MKKIKHIIMTAVIFACVGCGANETEVVNMPEASPVDEIREGSAQIESETEEKNDNYTDLEEKADSVEVSEFAAKIKTAVSDKDIEALADLCIYPTAVNSEVVEDREAFIALGEEIIFTEERCAVIEGVDVSTLEESMAGVVMGDATPNIIFKSVDGELGITGIN